MSKNVEGLQGVENGEENQETQTSDHCTTISFTSTQKNAHTRKLWTWERTDRKELYSEARQGHCDLGHSMPYTSVE